MQAKAMMMARETRSSMKAKARDGYSTIVTCSVLKKFVHCNIYISLSKDILWVYILVLCTICMV